MLTPSMLYCEIERWLNLYFCHRFINCLLPKITIVKGICQYFYDYAFYTLIMKGNFCICTDNYLTISNCIEYISTNHFVFALFMYWNNYIINSCFRSISTLFLDFDCVPFRWQNTYTLKCRNWHGTYTVTSLATHTHTYTGFATSIQCITW